MPRVMPRASMTRMTGASTSLASAALLVAAVQIEAVVKAFVAFNEAEISAWAE